MLAAQPGASGGPVAFGWFADKLWCVLSIFLQSANDTMNTDLVKVCENSREEAYFMLHSCVCSSF